MMESYLNSVKNRFQDYKVKGEKVFSQLDDGQLFWQFNKASNSIAIIVKHISGDMLSRWTDFLTSDGEKASRNRDIEFESDIKTRDELLSAWQAGWECLFTALNSLEEQDLQREVYIRNEPHTVVDVINRQLAHYSYHIGQIAFIGRMVAGANWKSLSITRRAIRYFQYAKIWFKR